MKIKEVVELCYPNKKIIKRGIDCKDIPIKDVFLFCSLHGFNYDSKVDMIILVEIEIQR